MDDTGVFQPTQNTSQQAVPDVPGGQMPQNSPQPVVQQPIQNAAPIPPSSQQEASPLSIPQPITPQQNIPTDTQPVDANGRITLHDLYGPSTPQERQSLTNNTPVQPEQPSVQPTISEQASPVPVENSSMQEVTQENPPVSPEVLSTPQIQEPKQEVPPEPAGPALFTATQKASSTSQEAQTSDEDMQGGGNFRITSILKFLVGAVVLLIVLLVVWGIVSFFSSRQNTGSGHVTLTYWGLWESPSVMQPVLAKFEQEHPNITVTYSQEDPKQYTQRLLTRMQQGDGPDVFRLNNTWISPLQSILLPLPTSVIDAKTLSTDYPPVVAKDMVMNGAIYGLPLQMDTLSLFVNTDIFSHAGASVPTTWDNFITVAKALTVKDPDGRIQTAGAAIGTYDNIEHAPDIVSLLLLQNGANLTNLTTGSNAKDALSFYTSFTSPDNSVWDTTLDNSLLAFEKGKVAMYFGYSYDIFAIKATNPSLNFTLYRVPHLPGRDITIATYWVEGVSNRSKHQKEALELMQYLAQKDTQTNIYTQEAKSRMFGELYARTDLAQGLVQNSLLKPFVQQFPQAQSSFFVADTDYDEYNGALNQYLGNAINSMLKDTSVDSATATLAQGVAQVTSQFAPKTQ